MSDMSNVVACLCDISKSLAVIADKLGEEEPENCVGCKHLTDPCELFPTDACKRCRRHYDDRYERRVTEEKDDKLS